MRPYLLSALMLSLLAAHLSYASAQMTEIDSQADSGIYGQMVRAWGNPPTNPAHYQCIKVLDDPQRKTIALGTCSGAFAQFRIPLAPGNYVVEYGGHWDSANGKIRFVPDRHHVTVPAGRWIDLSPAVPANAVP